MRTIHLHVDGMRCRRCVREATRLVRDLPGVVMVSADRSTSRVTITGAMTDDAVVDAFAHTSFAVRVIDALP